jgi:hypothetical protein
MQTADDLIRHLGAPDQRGMGRVETGESGITNIDRLASLDASAETIRVFDSTVIPGNLQTPAYSAAIIEAAHPRMGDMEVRRRVLLKEQRSRAFLRRTFDPRLVGAWYVIGERAITRCIDFDLHLEQLYHIKAMAAHYKLSIQILPDNKVPAGLADEFALYGLDGERRVGYVETIMGAWYSTRLDDVAKLHSAFSDIAGEAMSPTSSLTFIREALASWRSAKNTSPEPTEEPRSSSARTVEQGMTALESPRAPWRSEP